jgi:hypothetical protein
MVSDWERVVGVGRGSRSRSRTERWIVKSRNFASHGLSCSGDQAIGLAAARSEERHSEERHLDRCET